MEKKKPHYMMGGPMPQVVFPEFDFSKVSTATMITKQSRELNNGRLAMIGKFANSKRRWCLNGNGTNALMK